MTASNRTQYLSFLIDNEEYCVNILTVQEIRGWEKTKPLPHAPDFVLGLVNLRGEVIPIVDLRVRFGLEKVDYTPTTVVIYLKLASLGCEKQNQEPEQVIGVVVDAVSEVYAIEEKDKKPTPGIIGAVEEKYIEAIALVGEKMVAIIDMRRVFDLSELKSLADG